MNGTQNDRRNQILSRIGSRCIEEDTGFKIKGISSPCHVWQGGTSGKGNGAGRGYGRISLDGKTCATHLIMFTHYYGYIPANKQVDHLCNNRLCCNPAHLELVTPKENQRRRVKRIAEASPIFYTD